MVTIFGIEVDLLNPTSEMIDVRDIAYSLGRQCRYNGMTSQHCSVAEHSVMVAFMVKEAGGTKHDQFCGLMHDAHEAYIGDMIQPMKTMPELGAAYKKLEDIWIAAVARKYDLCIDERTVERVYNSDMNAAATEMRDLTKFEEDVWRGVGNAREQKIERTMDARAARWAFLETFLHLGGEKTWEGTRNGY
jgi:5'-deoxynucleotidase YfbR-like HD superfamily hydrolase